MVLKEDVDFVDILFSLESPSDVRDKSSEGPPLSSVAGVDLCESRSKSWMPLGFRISLKHPKEEDPDSSLRRARASFPD
jgi:hypothetical protein